MDSLGEARIFTTLDANCGYWQIPVHEDDQHKTAFVTHVGLFEYKRMPFGLTNAPATFQRAIDRALQRFKWKSCIVYLDDVVVFSSSIKDHILHVDEILSVLREVGVSLKFKKCEFFTDCIKYLGHIIRPGRLEIDSASTLALKKAKPPINVTQLRSFLGSTNVYRRFIEGYAKVAAPLVKLLKDLPEGCDKKGSEHPVVLDEEAQVAFRNLVDKICSPPVLALPVAGRRFLLDTDASAEQIGCALFQEDEEAVRKPVGYWSRQLISAEQNYSATERECLALV